MNQDHANQMVWKFAAACQSLLDPSEALAGFQALSMPSMR